MRWDKLSIFRKKCAIACGTRVYMLRGFCGCRAGEIASKILEIFYTFGPQLNAFTSVGILLKYFRRKLLLSEVSLYWSNLGVSRFIYIAGQVEFRCSGPFTRTSHYSTLSSHMWKIDSFSTTYSKTNKLDIFAAFQDFKVFLLLPHACEDFARVFATEK